MTTLRILFVYNWVPDEERTEAFRECASTKTVQRLTTVFQSYQMEVIPLNLFSKEQLAEAVQVNQPDIAFVIAEGFLDEPETLYDGSGALSIRVVLEGLDVPYSHSDVQAMEACRNKDITYEKLGQKEIAIPRFFVFSDIQEKTIRRVGDTKDRKIDVRIISTINEDPINAIAEGRLRKDLYYRLSVVSLFIPPLRERLEDIEPLMKHFIELYNYKFHMNVKGVANDTLHQLYNYDWPGNVRELEHMVEAAMNLMMDEEEITMTYLPRIFQQRFLSPKQTQVKVEAPKVNDLHPKVGLPLKTYLDRIEEQYVNSALSDHNGNISRTAEALGLSRQNLQYRIRKFKNKQG